MKRHTVKMVTVAALSLGVVMSTARAFTLQDGDFALWSTTTITAGSATHSGTVLPTGGNPGARWYDSITELDGINTYGVNLKLDYVNTAALSGGDTWTLSVDGLSGPPPGTYEGWGLAIKQGSSIWIQAEGLAGLPVVTEWTKYTVMGNFNPASFTLIAGPSGSPNFSAGSETTFGFYTRISQGSTTYSVYYDNWTLSSPVLAAPIPEPSTYIAAALMGTVLLGSGVKRIYRRRIQAVRI